MTVPRRPGDGAARGGGASRVSKTISSVTGRTDTSWYAVDGGADLAPGEYELIIRGTAPTDVYELTWASLASAAEQSALTGTEKGRAVWVNSPILITVAPGMPRLSVRALASGGNWTAELAPLV